MILKKTQPLVASVKPKNADVQDPNFLRGRYFTAGAVTKVDAETALACEKDGRFLVIWHEKKPEPAKQDPTPAAEPEPAEENAAEDPEPEPAPEPEPEPEPEVDLDAVLAEFDDLLVRETEDYLDAIKDPKVLKHLVENAAKKGSRENAQIRLDEVQEG